MKTALPSFDQLVTQLTKEASSRREAFRVDAVIAYEKCASKNRILMRSFETTRVTARDVFEAWQEHLLPLHQTIEAPRSQSAFRRHIAKHLSLEMAAAQQKAEALICERNHQALTDVLDMLYTGRRSKKARRRAERFLMQPDGIIGEYQQCYITYCAYREVATRHGIVVVDPHAPFYARLLSQLALWRERKITTTNETRRLAEVHVRLNELAAAHDGLIKAASEYKWDLATAVSLRAQYEKHVACLSEQEAKDGLKRLAAFDEVTREFRQKHIEQHASTHDNLKNMHAIATGIDRFLLHLFELSNAEKNQFMVSVKEYRELMRERAAIRHIQDHRFTI